MKENKIIYFQLNNWFAGRDYPNSEPFLSWLGNDLKLRFSNEKWVNDNKLCVSAGFIDMSVSYRVTATKEWVDKNCPELLTKYTKFICEPDSDGNVEDKFGYYFKEYADENIGIEWIDEDE